MSENSATATPNVANGETNSDVLHCIHQCNTNFQTLLRQSLTLNHQAENVDWNQIIANSSSLASNNLTSEVSTTKNFMDSAEEDDEDLASLLKRASSVHAALLLSLPSVTKSNSSVDLKELVQQLIPSILLNASQPTPTTSSATDEDAKINGNDSHYKQSAAWKDLVTALSFAVSSSSFDNVSNNFSEGKWMRICFTNTLLAVQYLLHLVQYEAKYESPLDSMGGTLEGWNLIILPLLFGISQKRALVLIKNDVLRNALLNLHPSTSKSSMKALTSNNIEQTPFCNALFLQSKQACNLCLHALYQATNSPEKMRYRQKTIVVICQVLYRLLADVTNLSKSIGALKETNSDLLESLAKEVTELVETVKDAMHESILMIIRGVCYDTVYMPDADEGDPTAQPPLLSLEALRPVTGILLQQLYPTNDGTLALSVDKRVAELWREVLLLLEPYSDSFVEEVGIGRKKYHSQNKNVRLKHCQNWENVAPMAATSILCLILPTFRALELPSAPLKVVNAPSHNDSSVEQETPDQKIRPSFQPSLWRLIRQCLGRSGDADNFGGNTRGGGDGGNPRNNADSGDKKQSSGNKTGGKRDGSSLVAATRNHDDEGYDNMDDLDVYDDAAIDQLLRRRSAHALRLLIEYERKKLVESSPKKNKDKKKKGPNPQKATQGDPSDFNKKLLRADLWTKYVLCFEMLEMEVELHLVDQCWPTVLELCVACETAPAKKNVDDEEKEAHDQLPCIVWADLSSLLSRVLLSDAPTLRKLGLYRWLSGGAGVDVQVPTKKSMDEAVESKDDINDNTYKKKPKNKHKIKKKSGGSKLEPASLFIVSVPFVDIVMRSYNSLVSTKVGTNIQIEEGGKLKSINVTPLFSQFISNYVTTLARFEDGNDRLSQFVSGVFGPKLMQSYKSRCLVLIYRSVTSALEKLSVDSESNIVVDIEPETIKASIRSLILLFASGGAPKLMQESIKFDIAVVLKHSTPWEKPDPSLILQVLAIYPPTKNVSEIDGAKTSDSEKQRLSSRDALKTWLLNLSGGNWAKNAAPALASAFISGDLVPYIEIEYSSGIDKNSREVGMSICTLCSLTGDASEMLWPAVFKGLQSVPSTHTSTPSFQKANRSMILLEFGCREGSLSGLGNGEIVYDESTNCVMPPPPNIELLLNNAAQFVMSQVMAISTFLGHSIRGEHGSSTGSTRSSTSHSVSSYILMLLDQIRTLHESFPSSAALASSAKHMLDASISSISAAAKYQENNSYSENPVDVVKYLTLIFVSLTCGATFDSSGQVESNSLEHTCQIILRASFSVPPGMSTKKEVEQACRSVFEYAKWGSLSFLLPMIENKLELPPEKLTSSDLIPVKQLFEEVFEVARDSVQSTPVVALSPLFETAISAGKQTVRLNSSGNNGQENSTLLLSIQKIIKTLFGVMEEITNNSTWMHMLNESCKLIFSPKLLTEEYMVSYTNNDLDFMPILHAFEKVMHLGKGRSRVCTTAVCHISKSWLGLENSEAGLCAIPYRDHIANLLMYKEGKIDENAVNQSSQHGDRLNEELPYPTDYSSVTRSFVLSFLSKLPSPENISGLVLKELVQYVMMHLLDNVCSVKPKAGDAFISGSNEYARRIRAWQALCLLSCYVTNDIAEDVATKVFQSMSFNLHGQIRYFIEVFTIQCTRNHPSIFGHKYIQEIRRRDLSLQYVSSLMVIGGNIIVGRWSSDFFQSTMSQRTKDVLCAVLPWLSSTQGFSRAIAQLLVHKLIPFVVDVKESNSIEAIEKDDAVLRSIYSFLEDNSEMCRLRSKQQRFFDSYDVENACTLEGLLSIPVDEGDEANPLHMVEAVKNCLADVYKEAHDNDAPAWKQMEELLIDAERANQSDSSQSEEPGFVVLNEAELVNFQRKILPIDALDLSLQAYGERQQYNAAGKKKQSLIVCATLVDKVPNLAGLARTAEIFAAQTLVVPDILVRRLDNFKSISVSANDWIDMEECKEEDLLKWLQLKKSKGYTIVGLEQTSSSKCITKINFPEKTVLLLGKEKEGIPVEYLSAVDQCIEIPQLGIIRSLNVHVTGAIAIWKYTEQMMMQRNT